MSEHHFFAVEGQHTVTNSRPGWDVNGSLPVPEVAMQVGGGTEDFDRQIQSMPDVIE